MLQAGVPLKTRLPLVLYKGLLRKAQLFDRYPILKAYSKNPLRRGTLYIPSVSFHTIIKESFRLTKNEYHFDVAQGFKLFREWNDVYLAVSKKITWYNQTIPESIHQKEPIVKHILSIIPGSVLVSHPAAFEKNEGSEVVLVLQRNEYETMGLLIQGRDFLEDLEEEESNSLLSTNNNKRERNYAQSSVISGAEFAEELKDTLSYDDEQRKYIIVDTSGDVNAPFAIHKIDLPYKDDGDEEEYYEDEEDDVQRHGTRDNDDAEGDDYYGYDAYDENEENGDVEAGEDDLVIKEVNVDVEIEDDVDGTGEERDLDQIADDGRGRDNSPTLTMKEDTSACGIVKNELSKEELSAKTIYKGGARFATKYVVVYTKPNKSELEGEWLSENLYFSVFHDKETMKKSKIVTLPPQQYRIFQGYHLFQTEVLEKQVADGSYFVCHSPLEILDFDKDLNNPPVLSTEEIWSKILMEMGGEFSHFAYARKSPIGMEKSKTE